MEKRDEDEFAAFVRAVTPGLFRTAYLLQGDYQRAEDLLQSTLMKIYLRWSKVRAMEHPAGYARKTLVNETTSWWRRRSSREQVLMLDHDLPVAATDDVALTHQMAWQAVLRLPPRQRAVIVLRYYEDLSEVETAQILDIAVGTVKSHCHSAVAQLGRILGEPTELNSGGIS